MFKPKYDYDIIVIGLGPAGMAVSIMGSEMGLKVCGIEKNKIGGECMNVGCIPSKSLISMAKRGLPYPHPFQKIQEYISYINDKKTMKMFQKVELLLGKGEASFIDKHTVAIGEKNISAKKIFICTGTRPQVPLFPGVENIKYLTNENIFNLEKIPKSMIIVGGGAIACEMAQAFARLGTTITIIIRGPRLMWRENKEATDIIEQTFIEEGITILREQTPALFEQKKNSIIMHTDKNEPVKAEQVLFACNRKMNFKSLKLDNAKIKYSDKRITVNNHLQTNIKNIYAVGDCNGHYQLSHAAMHQGMIALMHNMHFSKKFKKFVVPWTVFTEPQFSHVGMNEKQLKEKNIKYDTIKVNYSDYGAAIAEDVPKGFVKVFVSSLGKIYGAYIIGKGSGEMINELGLAIQKKIRIHDIMMLQHSFPTMSFLIKRVSEEWMMKKMQSEFIKKMCRLLFRLT
jgi:pyruvate/2-oxoglutarate dehydrogenase complex dihydrolipoamide dehydrogenase (E3) component